MKQKVPGTVQKSYCMLFCLLHNSKLVVEIRQIHMGSNAFIYLLIIQPNNYFRIDPEASFLLKLPLKYSNVMPSLVALAENYRHYY
jgi:hypothetical protein